jgi:Domain of unknown function (DUF397)
MRSPAAPVAEPHWRRSSYSGSTGGQCVEVSVASHDAAIAVRDSKDPAGPVLRFAAAAWQSFLTGACRGEFDIG